VVNNFRVSACPDCPACPVAPADGTGVAPEDGTGGSKHEPKKMVGVQKKSEKNFPRSFFMPIQTFFVTKTDYFC